MNLLKTPLWIIFLLSILSSILFHGYTLGMNLLIFNIILISSLGIMRSFLLKNKYWWAIAATTLLTAVFSYLYGNTFTILMNLLSVLVLGAMSSHPDTSFLINSFQSLYSQLGSPVHILLDSIASMNTKSKSQTRVGIFPIVIVLIIVILFLVMYSIISPVFHNLVSQFNWSWFSISWIFFTIFSFIILYPILRHHFIDNLYDYDRTHSNALSPQSRAQRDETLFASLMSYMQEIKAGVLLLILLNLVLLIVNGGDSYYLFYAQVLPDDLSYSEYVHNGVGTLIMSILMAIVILIFLFRGFNNFSTEGRWLKILAYIWILQNVILVATNVMKNYMYVEEYGLTYLRIGVYIYLTLCILGLLFTFYKIYLQKNILYLFRWNALALYSVLVAFSLIDWNTVITHQNIFLKSENKTTDWSYLIEDLPLKNAFVLEKYASENDSIDSNTRNQVSLKYVKYLNYLTKLNWRERTWKSASDLKLYHDHKNTNTIRELNIRDIDELDATVFECTPKLENLSIQYSDLENPDKISDLKNLHQLELKSCNLDSTFVLAPLPSLQYLNLNSNPQLLISNIHWNDGLLRLDLDYMNLIDEADLINITHVNTLNYTFYNDSLHNQFLHTRKDIFLTSENQNTSQR